MMTRISIIFLVGILGTISGNAANFDEEGYKAYQEGRLSEAINLFTKSCDSGDAKGCFSLAIMYDVVDDVKHDKVKASKLYKKSCDGGFAEGCYGLALAYDNGVGVKQSRINAVKLFTKACEGGHGESCFNVGSIYYDGTGVKKSTAKALDFFKKGCEVGNEDSCFAYNSSVNNVISTLKKASFKDLKAHANLATWAIVNGNQCQSTIDFIENTANIRTKTTKEAVSVLGELANTANCDFSYAPDKRYVLMQCHKINGSFIFTEKKETCERMANHGKDLMNQ